MIDNRLSALLGAKRLRITKVAADTGISRTTLTELYFGRSKAISFPVLNRLCMYLDCGPGDILVLIREAEA